MKELRFWPNTVTGDCHTTAYNRSRADLSNQLLVFTRLKMYISQESPDQPEVIELIEELDAYQDTLYPAEARYALDLASLKKSNVIFVVARNGEGRAVGCGAVVMTGSVGELKRVYVRPESRSQGVARSVLIELEASSSRAGCDELLLETGPYSKEALAFYEKLGYQRRGPFGAYPDHPLSVFMEKKLSTSSPGTTTQDR